MRPPLVWTLDAWAAEPSTASVGVATVAAQGTTLTSQGLDMAAPGRAADPDVVAMSKPASGLPARGDGMDAAAVGLDAQSHAQAAGGQRTKGKWSATQASGHPIPHYFMCTGAIRSYKAKYMYLS